MYEIKQENLISSLQLKSSLIIYTTTELNNIVSEVKGDKPGYIKMRNTLGTGDADKYAPTVHTSLFTLNNISYINKLELDAGSLTCQQRYGQ